MLNITKMNTQKILLFLIIFILLLIVILYIYKNFKIRKEKYAGEEDEKDEEERSLSSLGEDIKIYQSIIDVISSKGLDNNTGGFNLSKRYQLYQPYFERLFRDHYLLNVGMRDLMAKLTVNPETLASGVNLEGITQDEIPKLLDVHNKGFAVIYSTSFPGYWLFFRNVSDLSKDLYKRFKIPYYALLEEDISRNQKAERLIGFFDYYLNHPEIKSNNYFFDVKKTFELNDFDALILLKDYISPINSVRKTLELLSTDFSKENELTQEQTDLISKIKNDGFTVVQSYQNPGKPKFWLILRSIEDLIRFWIRRFGYESLPEKYKNIYFKDEFEEKNKTDQWRKFEYVAKDLSREKEIPSLLTISLQYYLDHFNDENIEKMLELPDDILLNLLLPSLKIKGLIKFYNFNEVGKALVKEYFDRVISIQGPLGNIDLPTQFIDIDYYRTFFITSSSSSSSSSFQNDNLDIVEKIFNAIIPKMSMRVRIKGIEYIIINPYTYGDDYFMYIDNFYFDKFVQNYRLENYDKNLVNFEGIVMKYDLIGKHRDDTYKIPRIIDTLENNLNMVVINGEWELESLYQGKVFEKFLTGNVENLNILFQNINKYKLGYTLFSFIKNVKLIYGSQIWKDILKPTYHQYMKENGNENKNSEIILNELLKDL